MDCQFGVVARLKNSDNYSNTHHGLPKIMTWTEGRPRKTKLGIHDEARFRGIIGREFYVHSGGFKSVGRLCIGGDCFEIMWSINGDDLQSPLEATRVSHWRAEHT